LIAAGRVSVDGDVVREQGLRVDPARVAILVDGTRIHAAEGQLTVAVNKPKGVVSTMSDPQGRPALDTLVARFDQRLFHVGRLDSDTSGLILLTNDGDLANRLAHPSHGVEKVYVAKVAGRVPRTLPATLLAGVELDDGPAAADACVVKAVAGNTSIVELTLHEGRNRIVRRMFDAVGYPVIDLSRVRFGPISLGALGPGKARALSSAEVGELLEAAGL
jgi:23S rRNA pseudouridine2605 synthase